MKYYSQLICDLESNDPILINDMEDNLWHKKITDEFCNKQGFLRFSGASGDEQGIVVRVEDDIPLEDVKVLMVATVNNNLIFHL